MGDVNAVLPEEIHKRAIGLVVGNPPLIDNEPVFECLVTKLHVVVVPFARFAVGLLPGVQHLVQ